MRFRSKEQGTRVKDRAKNGTSKRAERGWGRNPNPNLSFLPLPLPPLSFFGSHFISSAAKTGLSLLRSQMETLATQANTWCIRQMATTVTTAHGDQKADLTNGRAAKLNMSTGSRVQSLPRTCWCVACEKSAYLQREPPTPPPSLILSSEYTSLLLIRAYTNFRPHTTFVLKQKVFADFYFLFL